MRIIADLHIHSHYSRATSPKLTLPYLDRWARIKGIDLVGTGDCTHPGWLAELKDQLEPVEGGFFRLKPALRREFDSGTARAENLPGAAENGAESDDNNHEQSKEGRGNAGKPVHFVLTGEISTIYKRDEKTRKIHHVVILPDFKAAAAFQARLERIGNISSDGRPILGVDSRDLFATLLDADERAILVPAHIWTPWFSALGARSGFDSIEECYGDLTSRIGAIETGLSSNPPMNWAVSALDRFGIISNSDAHSPEKLGREATVFEMENSFAGLSAALGPSRAGAGREEETSGAEPNAGLGSGQPGAAAKADTATMSGAEREAAGRIAGTIEFFPQEGKYHYDGHRACGVVFSPEESTAHNGLCPVCGKPLTQGVMRRVTELADRSLDETTPCPNDYEGTNRRPYSSLIPLPELLGEILGTGSGSKKVAAAYNALIQRSGNEFSILLDRSEAQIESLGTVGVSGELLAMAIDRMRSGQVSIQPGYDGEYGVIHAFAPGEHFESTAQKGLFGDELKINTPTKAPQSQTAPSNSTPPPIQKKMTTPTAVSPTAPSPHFSTFALDPAQEAAVNHPGGPALIIAGPGTGKTAVLALRIAHLVECGLDPSSILAITFTNKAATELRDRIKKTIGEEKAARLTASTFHAFCLSLLREHAAAAALPSDFLVLDEEEKAIYLKQAIANEGTDPEAAGVSKKSDLKSSDTGSAAKSKGEAKTRRLGSYIEKRKRFLLLPGDGSPRLGSGAPEGLTEMAIEFGAEPSDPKLDEGYARYRMALKEAHALDFDDLVAGAVRLLAARPELLAAFRAQFRAIFVDEYQDVNFAQYALIRLLAPSPRIAPVSHAREPLADSAAVQTTHEAPGICVIGDPNQAIYGFRGSDRRFIERFLADYPSAAIYRLVRSFRCAPDIIGAAGRLVDTELDGSGTTVALSRTEYPTGASEAEGIAREIDRLIGGTRFFAIDSGVAESRRPHESPTDVVMNHQERDAQSKVSRGNVQKNNGAPPIASEEPSLSSLGECAILIRAAALAPSIEKALLDHGIPYRFIGEKPWWEEEPARSVIASLRVAPRGEGRSPADEVRTAISILYQQAPLGTSRSTQDKLLADPSLARLITQASLYSDLPSFLDDLALGSPQDGYDAHQECVSLMTIHAAKGLEFDYVFVAGLEEGILPFTLFEKYGGAKSARVKDEKDERNGPGAYSQNEDSQNGSPQASAFTERVEEERRLLYVAMTRARAGLYLSWARSRYFLGRRLTLPASRFLTQIEDLVPMQEHRAKPQKPKDAQLSLF